jgi:hypothetical protein
MSIAVAFIVIHGLIAACGGPQQCVPSCVGKACGDNGCGGTCGSCPSGQTCAAEACTGATADGGCEGFVLPDAGSGACSLGASGGSCPTGQTCVAGSCCTNVCASACCADSDACIGGACCPSAQACGNACCSSGSVCYSDSAGNMQCGQTCASSTDCATSCCGLLPGGTSVCVTQDGSWNCRCDTSADCAGLASTPECAPSFSTIGGSEVVAGPYICKPDDGQPGDGCEGLTVTCSGSAWHCATDSRGNQFCTTYCSTDVDCGNSGAACCDVQRGSSSACGLCSNP